MGITLITLGLLMISASAFAVRSQQKKKWESKEKPIEIVHVNNSSTPDWTTAIPEKEGAAESIDKNSQFPIL